MPTATYQHLLKPGQLHPGLLTLDAPGDVLTIACVSGARRFQGREFFWRPNGGPLPPSDQIDGHYELCTAGYYSKKVRGTFYHILPDPIRMLPTVHGGAGGGLGVSGGVSGVRTEAGFHFDAGPKGTLCCIGACDAIDFVTAEQWLARRAAAGLKRIPLIVYP